MKPRKSSKKRSKSPKPLCMVCKKPPKNPLYCEKCDRLICKSCINSLDKNDSACCIHTEGLHKSIPNHYQKPLNSMETKCEHCSETIVFADYEKHSATHKRKCMKCGGIFINNEESNHDCVTYLSQEIDTLKKSLQEFSRIFSHSTDTQNNILVICPKVRHQGLCKVCKKSLCGLCSKLCGKCNQPICETCFDLKNNICLLCSPNCKLCFESMKNSAICEDCNSKFCTNCVKFCQVCNKMVCLNCAKQCESCKNDHICSDCLKTECSECKKLCCLKCVTQACTQCSQSVCKSCSVKNPMQMCSECYIPCCSKCLHETSTDRIKYCHECWKAANMTCPKCEINCKKERIVKCEICQCTFCNLELYWKCESCNKITCEECGQILLTNSKYKYYCKGCITKCAKCKTTIVKEFSSECLLCKNLYCEDCATQVIMQCVSCKIPCCSECRKSCDTCSDSFCKKCQQTSLITCSKCQANVCLKGGKQCQACGISSCAKCVNILADKCRGCNKCGTACALCKVLICPLSIKQCIICHKPFGEQCCESIQINDSIKNKCMKNTYICGVCKPKKKLCGYCHKIGCFCSEKCKCNTICNKCGIECCPNCAEQCKKCRKSYCPSCKGGIKTQCINCKKEFLAHPGCIQSNAQVCGNCIVNFSKCSCGCYQKVNSLLRCQCGISLCQECQKAKCSNCGRGFCEKCWKSKPCEDCNLCHCSQCKELLISKDGKCINSKIGQICAICHKSGAINKCGITMCQNNLCAVCGNLYKCLSCSQIYCSEKCLNEAIKLEGCIRCKEKKCIKCLRKCSRCVNLTCLKCCKKCIECKKIFCSECKPKCSIYPCDGCQRDLCMECMGGCLVCSWKILDFQGSNVYFKIEGNNAQCKVCDMYKPPALRGNLEFCKGIHRFEIKYKFKQGGAQILKNQGFGIIPTQLYKSCGIVKRMIGIFMTGKTRKLLQENIPNISLEGSFILTVDKIKNQISFESGKLKLEGKLEQSLNYVPCFSFGNIGDYIEVKKIVLI